MCSFYTASTSSLVSNSLRLPWLIDIDIPYSLLTGRSLPKQCFHVASSILKPCQLCPSVSSSPKHMALTKLKRRHALLPFAQLDPCTIQQNEVTEIWVTIDPRWPLPFDLPLSALLFSAGIMRRAIAFWADGGGRILSRFLPHPTPSRAVCHHAPNPLHFLRQ